MEGIKFREVSFKYPSCEKKILDNITMDIEPSSFIVICGKSGCGKTTFLRHLKKNLRPYGQLEGKILYNGVEISQLDDRVSAMEIGFVQQDPENQIVTDKVWHELAFGLESLGYSNTVIRKRVSEMASFFGIQNWFRKSTYELSGGQKQLLNLASIMAMQPKVIILDEPTSQLDPIAATEFLETLQKINRELGTTIIISEHRLEELFPMADKIIVMNEGKVIAYDYVNKIVEFLSKDDNRHARFLGLPAPMKIYMKLKGSGSCPITVKEGRRWLKTIVGENPKHCRIEARQEDKKQKDKKQKDKALAIDISDVWFRYSKEGEDIIRGLSLKVPKGSIYSIVGGNGVGKSTALKLIMGLNKPYRGKVLINNVNIKKYDKSELFRTNVGVVPQNPQALFTEITVEEELYEVFSYSKIKEEDARKEVHRVVELLQLDNLLKNHPYDLSGGEQQRLALGKVLLLNPNILLLDEPTKGLDPFLKEILGDILLELKKSGTTILMVTHDIEFSSEYSDVCAMFFDGEIVSQGEPRSFFSDNSFYTTSANRMSRNIFENAITYRDVIYLCDKNMMKQDLQVQEGRGQF